MIIKLILVLVSLSSMVNPLSHAVGRPPERIDHIACQVQLYDKLDKIQETEDPNAMAVAYFNRSGLVCKTYCKFKSSNRNVAQITTIIDSPYYMMCAKDRYCSKGGKCKRIGTPLKLDECKTTNEGGITEPSIPTTSISVEGAQDGSKQTSKSPSNDESNGKTTVAPKPDVPTKEKDGDEE